MKMKVISLLTVCVILTSCQTKEETPTLTDTIQTIGTEISNSISNQKNLKELSIWYYMENRRWPKERNELEELIRYKNAPFKLDEFTQLEFTELENGDLSIFYSRPGIHGAATGTFEILKATAIEMMMQNKLNQYKEEVITSRSSQFLSRSALQS